MSQTVGGRTVSHTMDPRRGAPLDNDLASVTVLAPTAMAADAWATALMVLGRERGAALADRLGLKAVFVKNDGEVVETEGLLERSFPRARQAAGNVEGVRDSERRTLAPDGSPGSATQGGKCGFCSPPDLAHALPWAAPLTSKLTGS